MNGVTKGNKFSFFLKFATFVCLKRRSLESRHGSRQADEVNKKLMWEDFTRVNISFIKSFRRKHDRKKPSKVVLESKFVYVTKEVRNLIALFSTCGQKNESTEAAKGGTDSTR